MDGSGTALYYQSTPPRIGQTFLRMSAMLPQQNACDIFSMFQRQLIFFGIGDVEQVVYASRSSHIANFEHPLSGPKSAGTKPAKT